MSHANSGVLEEVGLGAVGEVVPVAVGRRVVDTLEHLEEKRFEFVFGCSISG